MWIAEMTVVTDEVMAAFERLIPQLTEHGAPPTREALIALAESPDTAVFLARQPDTEGLIVGSATLALSHTPTGCHGWIEDVVVDREARGQGLGRALTEALLEKARALGLRQVFLTSHPGRLAANRLYHSLGFVRRETNVYRYDLS